MLETYARRIRLSNTVNTHDVTAALWTHQRVLAAQHERPVLQGYQGSNDDEARHALMTPRQQQMMTKNGVGYVGALAMGVSV